METQTNTKKTFGKSFKGLFLNDDVVEETTKTQTVIAAAPLLSTAAPSLNIGVDLEMKNMLQKKLEEGKLDGFDYIKFKGSTDQMKSAIPDESTRFRAAFAAAQSMGMSKEELIKTAKHYLDVLKVEEDEFSLTIKDRQSTKVSTLENQIVSIDRTIQEKSESIKKLTDEINAVQQEKIALTAQASQERLKIETVKSKFDSALNNLRQEISADIEKIQILIQ